MRFRRICSKGRRPANEGDWVHPAFSGELDADGVLWGRGAIDTKITVCGILEAVEARIKEGFVPARDIWIAFSGDEEIMGPSAPAIVDWFDERGVATAPETRQAQRVLADCEPMRRIRRRESHHLGEVIDEAIQQAVASERSQGRRHFPPFAQNAEEGPRLVSRRLFTWATRNTWVR